MDTAETQWVLELDNNRWPVLAHQVVSSDEHQALTMCGQKYSAHRLGVAWWSTRPGELPIAEHAIHCRAVPI